MDAQTAPPGKAEAGRGREGAGEAAEATLPLFGQRFCGRTRGPGRQGLQVARSPGRGDLGPRPGSSPGGLCTAKLEKFWKGGGATSARRLPGLTGPPLGVPRSPSPLHPKLHIRSPPARKSPSPLF